MMGKVLNESTYKKLNNILIFLPHTWEAELKFPIKSPTSYLQTES